jgi:hypothetical protein
MKNTCPFFNRLWLFPLLLIFSTLTSSCTWFQPAQETKEERVYKEDDISQIQGKRVFDPMTGTWRIVREVNEKVDTVQWKELPPSRYPPIKSDGSWSSATSGNQSSGNSNSSTGKAFNVALVLPFLTKLSNNVVNPNSLWAVQFYAGAKLAFEDLKEAGVNLNVSVLDTEGETTRMATLLKSSDLAKADLIIGPYKRENVLLTAEFSKKNKIPVVVPYTASMGMVEDNQYFIQVNPSLKSHCKAIAKHARNTYKTEDIVLVARDVEGEGDRLKLFQDANAEIEGGRSNAKFREMIISGTARDFSKIDVNPYIRTGRTNVFIVPSWSSEPYIYSLLRALMVKRTEGEDIVVYGMPQWLNFEQIDYEYFEKLKVHISSATFVDEANPAVSVFKRKYFETFGMVPGEEAFLGYDIMNYFGKNLKEWGKELYAKIDSKRFSGLQSKFTFERIVLTPGKSKENLNYYDQLENNFVYILRFSDFQFQPAE